MADAVDVSSTRASAARISPGRNRPADRACARSAWLGRRRRADRPPASSDDRQQRQLRNLLERHRDLDRRGRVAAPAERGVAADERTRELVLAPARAPRAAPYRSRPRSRARISVSRSARASAGSDPRTGRRASSRAPGSRARPAPRRSPTSSACARSRRSGSNARYSARCVGRVGRGTPLALDDLAAVERRPRTMSAAVIRS